MLCALRRFAGVGAAFHRLLGRLAGRLVLSNSPAPGVIAFNRWLYVHFDDTGVFHLLDFAKEETEKLGLPPPRLLTMVRDPVQRIISE